MRMPAEGGIITLEPGTYEISEPLLFKAKSQVNIEGSGWGTIIKKRGDGDAIVFQGSCGNCRVHGLTVQGDKDAKTGSGIVYRGGEWSGINMVDYCVSTASPKAAFATRATQEAVLVQHDHQLLAHEQPRRPDLQRL